MKLGKSFFETEQLAVIIDSVAVVQCLHEAFFTFNFLAADLAGAIKANKLVAVEKFLIAENFISFQSLVKIL